jgi:hypothetical protein
MSVAIKLLILTALLGILAAIFPTNIINTIGVPTLAIETFIDGVAAMISNFCSLADVFLVNGSALLMVKTITLFVFFYAQFKIIYPIFKIIAY